MWAGEGGEGEREGEVCCTSLLNTYLERLLLLLSLTRVQMASLEFKSEVSTVESR